MSRGALSEELQIVAKNFLGKELSIRELRLLPYIHYCLVNQQGIDPAKINQEERNILSEWNKKGYLEGGMNGLRISKDFLNFINECLRISYITQEQMLDEDEKENLEVSKDDKNKFLWKLRDKEVFGVIRLEMDYNNYPNLEDDPDSDLAEEIDDYEFSDEEVAEFEAKMRELDDLGELGNTQYIGNAYYIETSTEERMKELYNILIKNVKGAPEKSTITLELNYCPEWAQDE